MTWCAVKAGAHVMERRQIDDALHRGNLARIGHHDANEIDQLVFNQFVAVPDGIEDFADGDWRRRMLAHKTQCVLILGRRWVLHPIEAHGFDGFRKFRRLAGQQAVVNVMENPKLWPEPAALPDRVYRARNSRLIHANSMRYQPVLHTLGSLYPKGSDVHADPIHRAATRVRHRNAPPDKSHLWFR